MDSVWGREYHHLGDFCCRNWWSPDPCLQSA
uniref:Uncharacterized protein n=1 Tax=Arundo donax TaxID=35708 RepID=A0A0A8YT40_ARUDO